VSPPHPARKMKAICASENFDVFMVLPRPTAPITHAAKLEFLSKINPGNRGAVIFDFWVSDRPRRVKPRLKTNEALAIASVL
jgi:hypothetical protein